jgi:hypothetical protein
LVLLRPMLRCVGDTVKLMRWRWDVAPAEAPAEGVAAVVATAPALGAPTAAMTVTALSSALLVCGRCCSLGGEPVLHC